MARYKHIDTSPRFLAVDLERQLLPGTFEYALCKLIDYEIDLTGFDARYRNDLTGATAYKSTPDPLYDKRGTTTKQTKRYTCRLSAARNHRCAACVDVKRVGPAPGVPVELRGT
ncbi:MAG: hypothetical protein WAO76_10685 [Georgfuchsia sp.]